MTEMPTSNTQYVKMQQQDHTSYFFSPCSGAALCSALPALVGDELRCGGSILQMRKEEERIRFAGMRVIRRQRQSDRLMMLTPRTKVRMSTITWNNTCDDPENTTKRVDHFSSLRRTEITTGVIPVCLTTFLACVARWWLTRKC